MLAFEGARRRDVPQPRHRRRRPRRGGLKLPEIAGLASVPFARLSGRHHRGHRIVPRSMYHRLIGVRHGRLTSGIR
jgi:hypothetical protein